MKSLPNKFANFAASFHDWATSWTGGLPQLFKLPRLSSWLSHRFSKPAALVGIESFVALSLAVYYFFLTLPMADAPRFYDQDIFNRTFFTELSHHPFAQRDFSKDYPDLKTRLPGPMLTGQLTDIVLDYTIAKKSDFQTCTLGIGTRRYSLFSCTFATYQAFWLLLLFGLLIRYRADALVIILGTFAGLMLNLSMTSCEYFHPWDLPSLFFFTWAVLTYDNSKGILPLMAVVWLGALFKETTLCCALLILLGEHWPLKKRIVGFAVTVTAFAIAKKFLLLTYAVPIPFFSASNFFSGFRLPYNLQLTFSQGGLSQVVFVNAGTLLIMMLLPWRTYREMLFKLLAAVFITGILLFGIVVESRIWYEILPLGWMMISEAIGNRWRIIPETKTGPDVLRPNPALLDDQTMRVMKGSYWMMMSVLLFILVGVWVAADLIGPKPQEGNPSDQPVTQFRPASSPVLNDPGWTHMAGFINTNTRPAVIYLNNLAWTLATSPVAKVRNGPIAVELGEAVCELTQYQETLTVGTLAAAYAEAGSFDQAITTAQKACALASAHGEPELLERNQDLLMLYRHHRA